MEGIAFHRIHEELLNDNFAADAMPFSSEIQVLP